MKNVKAAKVEFYTPAGTLRYTLTDDVSSIDIEENSRDEADDCTIQVSNPSGTHSNRFYEGDEVRVYVQRQGESDLVHIWTGVVDTLRTSRHSSAYATLEVRAQDYVYWRLTHTYVTDTFEDEYAGAIVRATMANNAGDIDTSNVLDTTTSVPSIAFNNITLLAAIRRLSDLASAEFTGDKDKRLHFFPRGTRSSGAYADPARVVRGTFKVETNLSGFGNVIKIRGGSRAQLDKENATFSSYATLTGSTRKMARVYVSKDRLAQVEVYTNPTGYNADLRVRIQADNETGTAPIEEGNADRDLAYRTLSTAFLEVGGWTTFLLPSHAVAPGSHVWLIVEAATDGESQRVGVDASSNLLYRTYYPVPVIVERVDQDSIDTYGRVELPPLSDKNLSTEEEANLLADTQLAKASTPQRVAEYEVSEMDDVDLHASLVAWWKLDEGSGTTAADSSGNGLTGTLYGLTAWTSTGKYGAAADFVSNGVGLSNSSINVDHLTIRALDGTKSKTIEAWIRPRAYCSNGSVVFTTCNVGASSDGNGWAAILGPTGKLQFFMMGDAPTSGNPPEYTETQQGVGVVPLNEWTHVKWVYDGATKVVKFYINGALDAERTFTNANVVNHGTCQMGRIGAEDAGSGDELPFNGFIDEVRLYDRALTAAEAAWRFEAGQTTRSLDKANVGEKVEASFPLDGVTTGTSFILLRRRHRYDAGTGLYTLSHELADAERIQRVEDLLLRVYEKVQRVNDGLMGQAQGEIVDLIRTIRDTARVSDAVTATEHAVGSFKVGTAKVGFSSVG